MRTASSKDDIIIRIPRKMYDKNVQALLNHIEYKRIVGKSKATQKDVDVIMTEIKKDRKNTMKPLLDRIKERAK